MAESKHTPGPWTPEWSVAQGPGTERGWVVNGPDTDVYGSIAELPDDCRDLSAVRANAALIAAAPRLLAACRQALAALETFGHVSSTPERQEAESLARMELRTVIKDATGETP